MIIHRVVNQLHSLKEVAKEFRVSQQLVSKFCVKARKNPKFLDELSAEELDRSTSSEEVLWAVREYMNTGGHMGSLKEIRTWLKEEKHIAIKQNDCVLSPIFVALSSPAVQ